MTNPPYATGPADPNRPPHHAGPAGPAGQPGGSAAAPGPQSFRYQPHDPYGTFAAGQPAGPVLPPPPTFAERWGITGSNDRPRQVTVILQALWIYLAATALALIIGIVAALIATASAMFFVGIVFSVIVAAACFVLIWAIAREALGRFGFQDPRKVIYIGLGLLGLNALLGAFSSLKLIPGLVQILAVLLVLVLLFTKPVRAWLRDRPGNLPRNAPDQPPAAAPLMPQAPQQPVWRDVPPTAPRPPADGQNPAAPTGWPQPPQR